MEPSRAGGIVIVVAVVAGVVDPVAEAEAARAGRDRAEAMAVAAAPTRAVAPTVAEAGRTVVAGAAERLASSLAARSRRR